MEQEKILISLLLEKPARIVDVDLTVDDFTNPHCSKLFTLIQDLYQKFGSAILAEIAVKTTSIEFELFNQLTDGVLWFRYPDENSFKVFEAEIKSNRRKNIVSKIIEKFGAEDPDLVVKKISEATASEALTTESIKELADSVFADLEKEASGDVSLGLNSGIMFIDRYISGFYPGDLIIIGARPSVGKSALSLNIAMNALKAGKRVYWQALEEKRKKVFKRMVSNLSKIPVSKMHGRQMSETDWDLYHRASARIKDFKIHIDDESGLKSQEIASRILKHHHKFGKIDLIIIDHLQEIFEANANRHLGLSEALQNLKVVAKNLQTPIIVLSQMKRGVESRDDKRPDMSDLKESGDIEGKADVIMLLNRDFKAGSSTSNILNVDICKQRDGQTAYGQLVFVAETMEID